jgi:hypothetical protein
MLLPLFSLPLVAVSLANSWSFTFRPLQEVFQTEALTIHDLCYIILLSNCVLWLDILRKKFFASFFGDAYHPSPLATKKDDD